MRARRATKNWEICSKSGQDNTLNVQYLDKRFYYWDDHPTEQNIVIEICLYAPLVAVYKYGNAPVAILDNLDKCIEELQLIKLTEDEISSLEQNNSYHFIF